MDELLTRPLLPLRGIVIFPGVVTNVDVGREKSMHAVEAAMNRDKLLYVTTQKDTTIQDVVPADLYNIGCVVEIKQMLRLPNGGIRILIEGISRVEYTAIDDAVTRTGCFVGTAKALADVLSDDTETVRKKVMSMFTDPNHLRVEDKGNTENNPVFIYLDAFCTDREKFNELKTHYENGGLGDKAVKEYLFEVLEETLTPIRERRKYYDEHPEIVEDIVKEGSKKARLIASETLKRVRKAIGVEYFE